MAKKAKHGKPKKALSPKKDFDKPVKRPRQSRLPEMDDPKIESLENAALDYAAIRDQRQQLTAQEVPLKQELINLMKAEGRETYRHADIEIKLLHEKESVKVRVKKADTND